MENINFVSLILNGKIMNLNVIEWNLNFGSYNKAKPAEFSKDTEHSDVQDLYQYKIKPERKSQVS